MTVIYVAPSAVHIAPSSLHFVLYALIYILRIMLCYTLRCWPSGGTLRAGVLFFATRASLHLVMCSMACDLSCCAS